MVDKYELYNKISSVSDFNALPQKTKVAFINYMDERGLAEYVVKPMFDKDPNNPAQETQIRIIDVKPTIAEPDSTVTQTESISVASYELNSVEQVIELSAPDSDDLIEFTIDEPTLDETNLEELTCDEGYQLMQKTGSETQVCITDNSVSKLVERGWGTVVIF